MLSSVRSLGEGGRPLSQADPSLLPNLKGAEMQRNQTLNTAQESVTHLNSAVGMQSINDSIQYDLSKSPVKKTTIEAPVIKGGIPAQ
jgi:hypothetical protein